MERKAYKQLLEWKNNPLHKPLIVNGAAKWERRGCSILTHRLSISEHQQYERIKYIIFSPSISDRIHFA